MPLTVDTTGVEGMVRDLAAYAGHGTHTEEALYVVAGKILDTAISYSPYSTEADLVERVNRDVNLDFARYDLLSGDGVLTTNQGTRGPAGNQWLRETSAVTGKPTNYIMRGGDPRRWGAQRWARYQAANAQREQDLEQSLRIRTRLAKDSIGLTAQSWWQIAEDLGITLYSPRAAKAKDAVASDGRQYQNGTGFRHQSADGLELEFVNSMPSLIKQGGAGILQRAINTRLSAFETEVRKGVFEDMKAFASRYKGLEILAS